MSSSLQVGDIVTHADEYHKRGASKGTIESIKLDDSDKEREHAPIGYRVWWEEDSDNQITPTFRTYTSNELKLWNSPNLSS
jgi:hypothetical protein